MKGYNYIVDITTWIFECLVENSRKNSFEYKIRCRKSVIFLSKKLIFYLLINNS